MSESGHVVHISHESDVVSARRAADRLVAAIGFDTDARREICLAVSELATNLCKHAGGGRLTLRPLHDGERSGVEVESADAGPGIGDVEQAFADGFSTAGSLGYGLGSVNRLMDRVQVTAHGSVGRGTRIVCVRWLKRASTRGRSCPLTIGAASRARAGHGANGDTFVVRRWDRAALVGVIDGLGHGPAAHRAAQSAWRYVDDHHDRPLPDLFRGVARACLATRGVVMAAVRFDLARSTLTHAGIGNVETRIRQGSRFRAVPSVRGILGVGAASPRVSEHPWRRQDLLVLHTDGVDRRWERQDLDRLFEAPAETVAREVLRVAARPHDDATVVVVKGVE